MKLVKLSAIDSTNDFLKNLVKEAATENWTVVSTENQLKGRGQMQNKWHHYIFVRDSLRRPQT